MLYILLFLDCIILNRMFNCFSFQVKDAFLKKKSSTKGDKINGSIKALKRLDHKCNSSEHLNEVRNSIFINNSHCTVIRS